MKQKNCKETQILNPLTNRCINKNTKKGIELLFDKKDKDILKLYELINGKILKKCDENKIRNLKTKKCIKKPQIPKKELVSKKTQIPEKESILKKTQIPEKELVLKKEPILANKIKKILPFINRVSANIYHRNKYLVLMRRELKDKKEGCVRIYKENPDGSISYRIGNKIILKKRIGSDSVYGIVFLSEFRDKDKKLFTFASKVYEYNEKKTTMELKLLTYLTNVVRKDLCPHFPMFYGYVLCDNILDFNKDSFIKSNTYDKSISQDINKYPELIKFNKDIIRFNKGKDKFIIPKFITTFNELANGDLWAFLKYYINNSLYLANALIQQLLSIMFFNYYTKRVHRDTHPGNFLYHKIKAGGYFHYNLFGVDYYLENLGFLWVIWDFDLSVKDNEFIKTYNNTITRDDYNRIIMAYLSNSNLYKKRYLGYNIYNEIYQNDILYDFITKIYESTNNSLGNKISSYMQITTQYITINNLKDLIIKLPKKISESKLDGKNIFLTSLPEGAIIINKQNPYKLEEQNLF